MNERLPLRSLLILVVLALPHSGNAQYMFLDSNGDSISTQADTLRAISDTTRVAIWLDTSKNRDGSAAICAVDGMGHTVNSYEFILRATGGTVSFSNFTNHQTDMQTEFGLLFDDEEFYSGYGGGGLFSPGLRMLASVEVLVLDGSPTLQIVSSSHLGGTFLTSFGSRCGGVDSDNTMKLGLDWFDVDGLSPPLGGAQAPSIVAPHSIRVTEGFPVSLIARSAIPDGESQVQTRVEGLPSGLTQVRGATRSTGDFDVRVYGAAADQLPGLHEVTLRWIARTGTLADSAVTRVYLDRDARSGAEVEREVREVVLPRYSHGMSRGAARRLGVRASPILAGYLRDTALRPQWGNCAAALAFIGDTAYFDTLRTLIWGRFQGRVDIRTFRTLRLAQAALSVMATFSERVRAYLFDTTDPEVWRALPWWVDDGPREDLRVAMAAMSYQAISYSDHPDCEQFLQKDSERARSDGLASDRRHALGVIRKTRLKGFPAVWDEEDRPGRSR